MKFLKPKPKSVLSFDIGTKRIGLAYCDSLLITITLLPAVKRTKNFSEVTLIMQYIDFHNISGIIFGLPLDDKGQMTKQAKDCKSYGEDILRLIKLPYTFVNEHSSTWESINRFGLKKDKSGLIDSFSAKILLEQWIKEGPELKKYNP